jgi:hypothetical protein
MAQAMWKKQGHCKSREAATEEPAMERLQLRDRMDVIGSPR